MIVRPQSLHMVRADIIFNDRKFSYLEIDLDHMNKHNRSSWSSEEIAGFAQLMIEGTCLEPVSERKCGIERCRYYVIRKMVRRRPYKMVFCICTDFPEAIGIITFYKVRK